MRPALILVLGAWLIAMLSIAAFLDDDPCGPDLGRETCSTDMECECRFGPEPDQPQGDNQ